jgi:hypothetical protein
VSVVTVMGRAGPASGSPVVMLELREDSTAAA